MTSNDKISGLLAKFPGPVTLYPSRKKWLLVFLGGITFTVIGFFMIRNGESWGWPSTTFSGLMAAGAFAAMLPGAGNLTLDRDGFEAKTLFRGRRWRWADADGFTASAVPPSNIQIVVFNDLVQKPSALTDINIAITGRNAGLGDTYGFAAGDLALLMAAWRTLSIGEHHH